MSAVAERVSRYRWVALGMAILSQWSLALAPQVVGPLAPLFQPELGLTKAEVGFFSSSVYFGSWGVLLAAGTLTDRLGVRKMMMAGQVVTGLLLLSMSWAASFFHAALVMIIAGLGRGSGIPSSTKAVMDWFPPSTRATAMGVKQTGVPLAGIVTASVLPAVALTMGWRSAIAMVGLWVIGCGLITGIVYREGRQPDRARERGGSARAAVGALVRNRRVWLLSCVAILFSTVQLSLLAHLALYLKEVVLVPLVPEEAARIVAAGGYLALCNVGGGFGRIVWGVVSDRVFHGRRMLVVAIIGAISAAMAVGLAAFGPEHPLWMLSGIVFVFGTTSVGWNGMYHVLMVETAGRKHAGTGVGLVMSIGQAGSVVGPALVGFIVDLSGSYRTAWLFLATVSALGTLVAAAGSRGEKRPV